MHHEDFDAYKKAVLQISNNGGRVEPGHASDAKLASSSDEQPVVIGGES